MNHAWSNGAACIGVDPDIFFVDTKDLQKVRVAKSYCDKCPCRRPCLEWAHNTGQFGIWGGTTDAERSYAYRLLQAVASNLNRSINASSRYQVGNLDFSPGRNTDETLRHPDELGHPSDPSHIAYPSSRSPQVYRLAVAIRILRRERERVLESFRCNA